MINRLFLHFLFLKSGNCIIKSKQAKFPTCALLHRYFIRLQFIAKYKLTDLREAPIQVTYVCKLEWHWMTYNCSSASWAHFNVRLQKYFIVYSLFSESAIKVIFSSSLVKFLSFLALLNNTLTLLNLAYVYLSQIHFELHQPPHYLSM